MGFIRGGLLVIISILILITIIVGNMFLMVSMSLEYNNVNSQLKDVIQDINVSGESVTSIIDLSLPIMQASCSENACNISNESLTQNCSMMDSYPINYFNYSLNISCESIMNGSEFVYNESIDKLSLVMYESDYNCSGVISCFKESKGMPFFLLSKHTKDSQQSKFYWCLLVLVILTAILFLLTETKTNTPIILGSLLIIGSVPFIKMYEIVSWIFRWDFIEFLRIFFSKSLSVFWLSFTIGVVLLVLGILLKIFGIGFKLERMIGGE